MTCPRSPSPPRPPACSSVWDAIFAGPDPELVFEEETATCLAQFAELFSIADEDGDIIGHDNWGGQLYTHELLSTGQAVYIEQNIMPQTAGVTWDASIALSYYLEDHPHLVHGKRVLELGCGTALPGLVSALLGARETILTDLPEATQCARSSVERNVEQLAARAHTIVVQELTWGTPVAKSILKSQLDVLFMADVLGASRDSMVVDTPTGPFAMLLETLLLFAALPEPPKILVAYKRRLKRREEPFFGRLAQHFDIDVLEDQARPERRKFFACYVCELRAKSAPCGAAG